MILLTYLLKDQIFMELSAENEQINPFINLQKPTM